MKLLFPLLTLLTFTACTSTERESSGRGLVETIPADIKGEPSTTETVGETGRNHGYVRRFYQKNGRYYVDIDYIQFLNGEAAVAAARRKGDAQEEVVQGDTVYSVFNDYYIVNDNPQVRTLPLDGEATFTFWRSGENGLERFPASPAKVQADVPKILFLSPFVVEIQRGIVTSLTEQYVP